MIIKDNKGIEYFEHSAEDILKLLFSDKKSRSIIRYPKSLSHQIIPNIPLGEAKDIIESQFNNEGKEISRFFYDDLGQRIGLDVINYKKFEKLVDQLYKQKSIYTSISRATLVSLLFEWLRKRHCKKIEETESFVSFFELKAKSLIKRVQISIPIQFLDGDDTFIIGNVKFECFTKELFDKIENRLKEGIKQKKLTAEDAEKIINKIRKNYQGKIFGSVIVNAEKNKAIEIVEEKVENALLALKFFSPSAIFPKITAYFGRKGNMLPPQSHVFIFENEIPIIHEALKDDTRIGFSMDKLMLQRIYESGLSILSNILKKDKLTEYEELMLNSIFTFSKALGRKGTHEKMTFLLSAVEIAFLKNHSESILQSLGQRLGFFVFDKAQERRKVVDIIKQSYKIRSNFLHHGYFQQDYDVLRELLFIARKALHKMILRSADFKNKEEFIKYIDEIIYS